MQKCLYDLTILSVAQLSVLYNSQSFETSFVETMNRLNFDNDLKSQNRNNTKISTPLHRWNSNVLCFVL